MGNETCDESDSFHRFGGPEVLARRSAAIISGLGGVEPESNPDRSGLNLALPNSAALAPKYTDPLLFFGPL
jgi:hypothetical protein